MLVEPGYDILWVSHLNFVARVTKKLKIIWSNNNTVKNNFIENKTASWRAFRKSARILTAEIHEIKSPNLFCWESVSLNSRSIYTRVSYAERTHKWHSIIHPFSWFQAFAVFWMFYVFFWVIPRSLNFICRCFGTLSLFQLHRQVGMKKISSYLPAYEDGTVFQNIGI